MRVTTAVALALFTLGACGSDNTPPVLEITSPLRGTQLEGSSVTVTGTVHDTGKVRVTIAGTEVTPAKDGSFSTTVTVPAGLALIESHAIDDDGNDTRDVRAVLSGTLRPTDGTVQAPIAARAGTGALTAVGNAIAEKAKAIDFTAAVSAMNPVYDNGGCLGAVVNVTRVTLGDIGVALAPNTGVLSTDVTIQNVEVVASVRYKVACIGGSTTVTIRANTARIHGDLGLAVTSGALVASLPASSVAFDGFSFNASGIPGAIEDLIDGQVRNAVQNALAKVIRDRAPGMANAALTKMLAKPIATNLLGHETTFAILPSELTLSPQGLYVGVNTTVKITGGEGGVFASNPSATPSGLMQSEGLGIAIADDAINQMFAGLWAAGGFEQQLSVDSLQALATIFGPEASTIDIALALPPTVSSNSGKLELAIGDLLLTVRDTSGAEVQKLALSLRTALAAVPSGDQITLMLDAPTLYAQILAQADALANPMTEEQFEGLVAGAWGLVRSKADDALVRMPMPGIAGLALGTPSITGVQGFVIADVPVP